MAPLGRVTPAGWAALGGATGAHVADAGSGDSGGAHPVPLPRSEGAAPPDAPESEGAPADAVAASAAGASAAAPAVASPVPAAPRDVHAPDSDSSRLHPELREKVERVIQRMEVEHGLRVRLVEGYRSPERQLHLYAQGRTRPGPVVTWTKESRHQEGRAADLKVEGAKAELDGYVALHRIAREEGLKILGMKDPGHVELAGGSATRQVEGRRPGSEAAGASARPTAEVATRDVAGLGGGAPDATGVTSIAPRPARTAPVARTAMAARVAPVGHVASVARPSPVLGSGPASEPDTPRPLAPPPARPEAEPAAVARMAERAPARGVRPSRADDVPPSGDIAPPSPTQAVTPTTPSQGDVPRAPILGGPGLLGGSREAGGPDPMSRVERVLEALDARPGADVQRVVVRLDGSAGPVARVGVELADRVLRGQVQADDPALTDRLRADVGAVLRKLEASGYDARSIAVGLTSPDLPADGMGRVLHTLDAAPALRTILAATPGATGQEGRQRQGGEGRHGQAGQGPFDQRTPKDNRRER